MIWLILLVHQRAEIDLESITSFWELSYEIHAQVSMNWLKRQLMSLPELWIGKKKPQNLLKQQRKKRQVGNNIIIALQLATTCHATIHEFVNQLLNTCYYETRDKEREISDLKQVTSILALTSINCRHRWFTTCPVPQKRSSTNKEQMNNQQEQKARATNCDTNVQSTWTSSFWTRIITVVSISVSLQMVLSSLIKFLINLTSNLILRTNSNFIFDAEFNGNGKSQLFKFRL